MVTNEKITGAQIIAETMKKCGVDHFFYVSGGPYIYPDIQKEGIKTILCRNEKTAVNMADGYSRITGRPSVCFSQHGAAAHILASMLYEPMFAHSPVIALTGSYPTQKKDKWYYQECYEMKYFEETCKFNVDVTDANRLGEYLRIAIQLSVSGCPGPTHVNMHNDQAQATFKAPKIFKDKRFFRIPPFRPRPEIYRIHEATKLLVKAKRPIIICGSGVHFSIAYEEVRELAELLRIPVATNPQAKGCFPENHPLSIGVIGRYGGTVANDIVREADLVFFIGTRAGGHMTEDFSVPKLGESKIIHLDIDPIVINRNYFADVALLGDAKVTLKELLSILKKQDSKPASRENYLNEIVISVKKYENLINQMMNSDNIPIKPARIMRAITKILKKRDILVSDTGQAVCWTARFIKLKGTGISYLPSSGTLGSGLGLAMGASFGAEKNQRVLLFIGDGGMGYNLADLETMRRFNEDHSPFVVVVNNNSSLSMMRPLFEDWSKSEPPRINHSDFTEVDYAKIAEAFGCYGIRVEKPSELNDALCSAFKSGKPGVVDIVSDVRSYAPYGLMRKTNPEQVKRTFGIKEVY